LAGRDVEPAAAERDHHAEHDQVRHQHHRAVEAEGAYLQEQG
jgi:hypothetical protein